jgi:ribosomal protein S18 acetylase RimI-like enzyme
MKVELQIATAADVADLLSLREAVNQRLTAQFGKGYWVAGATEKGVLFAMKRGAMYVARDRHKPVATLTLSTRKPWAIDTKYFTAGKRPLYLSAMEVSPDTQRKGIGRQCLDEACRIAREWPADAIRLDAYDAAAGAGDFYRKCGFREVGRSIYRNAPLIYFEMLI